MAGKKRDIEKIRKIVYDFGFELISSEYNSIDQKLVIKDTNGYYYMSSLHNLSTGRYPRRFHRTNDYTIQNIKLWLRLNNKPYELISDKYYKNADKLTFKDENGYLFYTHLNSLINGYIPEKFYHSNPYTIQNIKLWCKLNNKSFELISDTYEGCGVKLKWQCLKKDCKEIFEMNWESIYSGVGCNFCCGRVAGFSNCLATLDPELTKEWHPTLNGDLTPYDITIGSGIDVWWQCKDNPKHEWYATIPNRSKNNSNCPYCSHRLASDDYNLLIINPKLCEEWDYDKNEKRPEEYTPNSGQYAWWKCKECGHGWESQIGSRNNGIGCPECNNSKGEKECKKIFDLRNVYYIPQKEFDGLIGLGGGLLSYDFYLPQYNLLIEYQGEQHEKYIPGFHKSKEDFEKQQEHDCRKKSYTIQNKYNFLEIWYWDFDNIETILDDYLNKLKIKG